MNFKRIETFVLVATLGSFRKAAEQQFTTQPAISTRIAGLEEELGVKLFDRDASPIVLTSQGKELLPYAEKMLYMAEQMHKRADISRLLSGTLRLGVSETIVHTWLTDFLKVLHQELPNLDVDMTVDVTGNLRNGLLDRSLDLAFLMGPVSEPTVNNLELCQFPLVWIASTQLDLPDKTIELEELVQYPIITYARNTRPFTEISEKFMQIDGLPARFFSSSSLSACLKLTQDQIGISSLPYAMVAPEITAGSLKKLNAKWEPSALSFTASYPSVPFNSAAKLAADIAVNVASEFELNANK
ncbi:putative Transcriptional regulator, LysR family protein [Vibrio nigripulchritudo MADA3029]|uniref:LysR family transcriptional regulator n=1 Tax=Vibrio nigripulchritudo TaxID=28173 RepID=UPI0003B1F6D2|nr:LysR family transcriptional regulator [Vibrio nigripulchritudo]KJY78706.1 LysR family transcriptional regulator [Vibrio nigripulchritudo]CCN50299.1 putative Transcriptional regulator, LysR family protein [Vibrio nigripulchritudo MADA3020]CCN53275.1 putative Transcriptional regulator, LysR family protein [Vibrio nigripulchritudo MADA3021]CCN60237.1 putative Transcriptional regulator, LysR family protein [Vibrio nigripulchritudo MADA3029]BDU40776.1 LysR family transcriptional regulator [Vibri